MQVGDLVRWTTSADASFGVVLGVTTRSASVQGTSSTCAAIYWFEDGRSCGYNTHHPNIEVIS